MLAKYVEACMGGRKLFLAFTVTAMFQINELLGDQELFEVLSCTGKQGFEQFCDIIRVLSCSGETIRQQEGYGKQEPLTKEQVAAYMTPVEYLELKKAAMDAVMIGYGREIVDEKEEVDVGLAELEKKTGQPGPTY